MPSNRLTIRKADLQGNVMFEYRGELVYQDELLLVARCIWEAPKPFEVEGFLLARGDIFMEHFYTKEWFNIFQVHSSLGQLKGWYCNITLPVEQDGETVTWRDLALDLLVFPNGRQLVLDQDEFDTMDLDQSMRAQAAAALERLRSRAREGAPPFVALRGS